ncbi:helix-turn-helix domain-containing protein [Streptomyces sp. H27-D2]|uniref:helix-turn-helix domain-containing protein n=1 Tax=Streptomyces sp. H27-D2 TaxID=3046304 RepID=UPI002DBB441F|nr:helix-turn-helix domain-containing protein [Streptomyces sp. H27-D2]MEC4019928.1 helix-turn-helix domain-containing protein [Streptomyces sp. H27-D2]
MRQETVPVRAWDVSCAGPHPRLLPGVHGYRGFRLHLIGPRRRLETPDGLVTLLLTFAGGLRISPAGPEGGGARRFGSLLAGLHTEARVGEHDGDLYGIEILLKPWMAFTLFGISMHELAETITEPSEVLGPRAELLTGALQDLPGWQDRFALLDLVLTEWAAAGPACSPQVAWAWDMLTSTHGLTPIGRLAAGAGWGRRQLESRFREQIGLTPKAASRVLRLQRAVRMLTQQGRPSDVAAACGFSDQAHFSREFKTMTSLTSRHFLKSRTTGTTWDRVDGAPTSVLLAV